MSDKVIGANDFDFCEFTNKTEDQDQWEILQNDKSCGKVQVKTIWSPTPVVKPEPD